jgi:hypothetical protein
MHQERPVFRVVTSAGEAEEHLRVIRQAMERSTRHSTLSGLSGIVVGLLALAGCALTETVVRDAVWPTRRFLFVAVWGGVLLLALAADFLFTKRRAARVGKTAFSPLGRHLALAAAPGFLAGLTLSLFYVFHPGLREGYWYLYGIWMLCYAVSLLAVGMFSLREVSLLGWAFFAAGAATLLLPAGFFLTPNTMMALTFGGFHIIYGVWMGSKYGW